MNTSTLTVKGQFTIPAPLRKTLELHAGDKLNCFVEGEKLIIVPIKGSIRNLKGMFGKPQKSASLEDIDQAIAEEASKRMLGR